MIASSRAETVPEPPPERPRSARHPICPSCARLPAAHRRNATQLGRRRVFRACLPAGGPSSMWCVVTRAQRAGWHARLETRRQAVAALHVRLHGRPVDDESWIRTASLTSRPPFARSPQQILLPASSAARFQTRPAFWAFVSRCPVSDSRVLPRGRLSFGDCVHQAGPPRSRRRKRLEPKPMLFLLCFACASLTYPLFSVAST